MHVNQRSAMPMSKAYLGQHLVQAEGVCLCRVLLELHRAAAAILRAVVHALEALHAQLHDISGRTHSIHAPKQATAYAQEWYCEHMCCSANKAMCSIQHRCARLQALEALL